MRRKVKAGLIELDIADCAIVVHYEVEATVLGDLGEPIVAERQDNTKRIKLKTLNENTNIPRLAQEMVEKCKLIHPSKLPLVEKLLEELQHHQIQRERGAAQPQAGAAARRARRTGEGGKKSKKTAAALDEPPSLQLLDSYVEGMYDGVESATTATHQILQLARSPDNLEGLLNNEALLGLLARLLKEEGRKSMDLAINIIYILYSFSNFSQFHQLLQQAHVGDNIMRLCDLEIKRQAVRERERAQQAGTSAGTAEAKEAEKRHRLVLRKQEKLLYVCFHVLLNLAEEPSIERKMCKRGIVGYLASMLTRQNMELVVLVLIFLKKLAIFKENVPDLKQHKVATLLLPHVASSTEAVQVSALRLLFNVSFDKSGRDALLKDASLLPKLVTLQKRRQAQPLVVRLLYHASAEAAGRAALAQTDLPGVVRKQLLQCADLQLPSELAALAINLATDAAAADVIGEAGAVRHFLERLLQTQDVLLMKLLRNLAAHDAPATRIVQYAADLIQLSQQADLHELLVELLGTLGALPLRRVAELPRLCHKYDLVEFLQRHLIPGFTEDDVLLEVVVLIGELAGSEEMAGKMARTKILRSLYLLITEKQEDDELVLQILYALYHFLQAAESRQALLTQTQLVIYLLDLLLDKNGAIRKMAFACLDVVSEHDEHWASQIRQRKFQMHNKEWLEVIDEDEAEEYEDAVALNNAMSTLQYNQPLDASQLGDDDDDMMEPPSPTEESLEAMAAAGYDPYGGGGGAPPYGANYGAAQPYGADAYDEAAAYDQPGAPYGAEAMMGGDYGGYGDADEVGGGYGGYGEADEVPAGYGGYGDADEVPGGYGGYGDADQVPGGYQIGDGDYGGYGDADPVADDDALQYGQSQYGGYGGHRQQYGEYGEGAIDDEFDQDRDYGR